MRSKMALVVAVLVVVVVVVVAVVAVLAVVAALVAVLVAVLVAADHVVLIQPLVLVEEVAVLFLVASVPVSPALCKMELELQACHPYD